MIFAKDYSDDQLPYSHSDRFLYARVLLSCIFLAASLFLVFIGKDSYIGVILITFGIVWNLFLPLNNFYSLVLSIMMGIVYTIVCSSIGLIANAFLYVAYYIPLQFAACQRKGDQFIQRNKEFSEREYTFIFFYYVVFFVALYFLSQTVNSSLLCFFDALSATFLAFSALARNCRIKNYHSIRFLAVGISIFLWSLMASASVMQPGVLSLLLMYIMYFIYEIIVCIYERRHYQTKQMTIDDLKEDEKKTKLVEKKKKDYEKLTAKQK